MGLLRLQTVSTWNSAGADDGSGGPELESVIGAIVKALWSTVPLCRKRPGEELLFANTLRRSGRMNVKCPKAGCRLRPFRGDRIDAWCRKIFHSEQ